MPSIISIFLVDTTSTIDLVITASSGAPAPGPKLLELTIVTGSSGPQLTVQDHSSGPLALNTLQSRVLPPGVYYFVSDGEIRCDIPEGRCRTIFVNGKNPISPPPPPAPAGTPLATYSSAYEAGFANVIAAESGSPGRHWMVIGLEEKRAQAATAG